MLLCIAAAYVYWTLLPPAVAVVAPHRGPAVQAVYATGTVEPSVMIPIAPRSAARLVELKVDEGSVVEKGQLLARLENDDLRRAIEVAEAEERYAKSQLDRQAQLIERGVAARSAYDRARADWEKAKALRERAEAEAALSRSGRARRRQDHPPRRRDRPDHRLPTSRFSGCRAAPRCASRPRSMRRTSHRSARGQEVLIRADAFPGQIFQGTVQSITPKGDPVARTYRVRVSLPPIRR